MKCIDWVALGAQLYFIVDFQCQTPTNERQLPRSSIGHSTLITCCILGFDAIP